MNTANVFCSSGGKDSTAMILLGIEEGTLNSKYVFADTGNEHQLTYEYLDYLESKLGISFNRVKANFSKEIERKRTSTMDKWRNEGISEKVIEEAMNILQPTGNPFLDLCLWKGRFPSTKSRFCTEELKIHPMNTQFIEPLLESKKFNRVISWQGVRAEESTKRAALPEYDIEFGCENSQEGLFNYRPILNWSAEEVFNFHRRHNIKWNPLYEKGMGRVGCMPCVNCTKPELKNIATQFPEVIERLKKWEAIVSIANKKNKSTFFPVSNDPTVNPHAEDIHHTTHGIERMVKWSKTTRGGRQTDWLTETEKPPSCQSLYGLCE